MYKLNCDYKQFDISRVLSFFSYSHLRKIYFNDISLQFDCLVGVCCDKNISRYSGKLVQLLLRDDEIMPSYAESICLSYASKNNHIQIVKMLIENGRVDVSCNEFYCLKISIERKHDELCELLSKECFPHKDDINYAAIFHLILQYDTCMLFNKLMNLDKEAIMDLVYKNADIIVINESYEILKCCICYIKSMHHIENYIGAKLMLFLKLSSSYGCVKMTKMLLKEIDTRDCKYDVLLSEATRSGRNNIVSIFLPLVSDIQRIQNYFTLIMFTRECYYECSKKYVRSIVKSRSTASIINDYIECIKLYAEDGRINLSEGSYYLIGKILYDEIMENNKLIEFLIQFIEYKHSFLFRQIIYYFDKTRSKHEYIFNSIMKNKIMTPNIASLILDKLPQNSDYDAYNENHVYFKKLLSQRMLENSL